MLARKRQVQIKPILVNFIYFWFSNRVWFSCLQERRNSCILARQKTMHSSILMMIMMTMILCEEELGHLVYSTFWILDRRLQANMKRSTSKYEEDFVGGYFSLFRRGIECVLFIYFVENELNTYALGFVLCPLEIHHFSLGLIATHLWT